MITIPTRVRGDSSPPLSITISDNRDDADFSTVDASDVMILIEHEGLTVVNAQATSITPSPDNKSAQVVRNWSDGELAEVGRYWVSVYITTWDQTFPGSGPLRLDVVRAAGDA